MQWEAALNEPPEACSACARSVRAQHAARRTSALTRVRPDASRRCSSARTWSNSACVLGSEHLRRANARICGAGAIHLAPQGVRRECCAQTRAAARTCCTAGCLRCVSSAKTLITPSGSTSPFALTTEPTELPCRERSARQRGAAQHGTSCACLLDQRLHQLRQRERQLAVQVALEKRAQAVEVDGLEVKELKVHLPPPRGLGRGAAWRRRTRRRRAGARLQLHKVAAFAVVGRGLLGRLVVVLVLVSAVLAVSAAAVVAVRHQVLRAASAVSCACGARQSAKRARHAPRCRRTPQQPPRPSLLRHRRAQPACALAASEAQEM